MDTKNVVSAISLSAALIVIYSLFFAPEPVQKTENLSKKEVIILGWAFKANTNDSRESASIYIAEMLYNSGINISIYDPMVSKEKIVNDIKDYWKEGGLFNKIETRINFLKDVKIDFSYFDAVAILTEWVQFKKFNFKGTRVYDGRNILMDSHYSIGN